MSRKAIAEALKALKVEDVFQSITKPTTVKENTPILQVMEALVRDPLTHVVYVVDEVGKLKGEIGDKEVLRWLSFQASEGKPPKERYFERTVDTLVFAMGTQAKHFMTLSRAVRVGDSLVSALNIMIDSGEEELAVVDENEVVIGDLSCLEVIYGMIYKVLKEEEDKSQRQ